VPLYIYECQKCGLEFEHTCMMSQHTKSRICACGGTANQIVTGGSGMIGLGSSRDWSQESGGRGKWNPQLNDYVKNPSDILEKGKAKGMARL
jgi:putative FmdB family regulatory protein